MNYQEYIKTDKWKEKAKAVKFFAGYRCQLCGKSGNDSTLHAHHNNYDNLGNETFTDLLCLCETCHTSHHGHDLTQKVVSYIKSGKVDTVELFRALADLHMTNFVYGLEDYETAARGWIEKLGLVENEYQFKILF